MKTLWAGRKCDLDSTRYYLSFIHTANKLHNYLLKRGSANYKFYFMNHIELFQGEAKK